MTESTLIVNPGTAGLYDEKHIEDPGVTMMAYDAWSVQALLSTLPKMSLCHLLTTTALKYPKVMEMVATTVTQDGTTTADKQQPFPGKPCNLSSSPLVSSSAQLHHHFDNEQQQHQHHHNPLSYYRELVAIQEQAYAIVHSLDGLRPSEQFAREAEVAQELQRLVRLCTNTLYAAPQGHSLIALIGLLVIAREGLAASSTKVRRYMFGGSGGGACLGRLVVLEMQAALKNYKVNPLEPNEQRGSEHQWPHLLRVLSPPKSVLAAADNRHQLTWIIDVLKQVCAQMAECDPHWTFAQEYHNVVVIATRNCRL